MKKNKSSVISAVLCVLCIFTIGILLFLKYSGKPIPDDVLTSGPTELTNQTDAVPECPCDFEKLQNQCPDVVAWLQIPGTEISFPVAFREDDNSYYLKRDLEGRYSKFGTLFIENYNKPDFSDPVSVIYGHHFSTGEMFGTLQSTYSNPEEFEKHRDVYLFFPENFKKYKIFSAVPIDDSHILYYNDFNIEYVYDRFFEKIYSTHSLLAVTDESMKPAFGERVLILCTCMSDDYSKRFLVLAKEQ